MILLFFNSVICLVFSSFYNEKDSFSDSLMYTFVLLAQFNKIYTY